MARVSVPVNCGYGPEAILHEAERTGCDVVVVRYPAKNVDWFSRLRSNTYLPLHADTLLYFEKANLKARTTESSVRVELISTDAQVAVLEQLAAAAFTDYKSHYFANPFLDRSGIPAGYAEWALSFAAPDDETRCALLAKRGSSDEIVGFATVALDSEPELALVAVAPSHSGHGLYAAILREVEAHLAVSGYEACAISTQVHNVPVIRSVTARDYRHVLSLQTVHLVHRRLLDSGSTK